MSNRSALVALKRSVEAYFQANNVQSDVFIGLKARDNWQKPRVIIIPGTFDGSSEPRPMSAGAFGAPKKKTTSNPRELASWTRDLTLSISSYNSTAKLSEEEQIEAQEDLVESTIQAVWKATDPTTGIIIGATNVTWGKAIHMHPPVQNAAGKELLLQFTLVTSFYDLPQPTVFPTPSLSTQLMSTTQSGSKASVTSTTGTLATITGLAFASGAWLGQWLTLSGAGSSGNNGTFQIVIIDDPTSIQVQNGSAVAPDANDGALSWSVGPRT